MSEQKTDWVASARATVDMGCTLNRGESIAVIDALDEALRLAKFWEESAAQFHRNDCHHAAQVDAIGAMLGPEAYTCDDGSVVPDVLRAKVVELCAQRLNRKPETKPNPLSPHTNQDGIER